ncbi:PAS domain-containing protein [Brevundimonas pondensis]|uniref:PAS domain-containing protein n=1 Tax=Brevundimonas pondensis TaxID=2774189 RepID=UPI001CED1C4E|nr:PAS-domain containing protein [Brevundimonas pondensis]
MQTTLDNIDQGVSVVDEDLRLTAWNRRYVEMFNLPAGFVHVGLPIAAVYRLNAERGETDPGDIEAWIERRLEALARRIPHDHEREQPDGRILRSSGAPSPAAATPPAIPTSPPCAAPPAIWRKPTSGWRPAWPTAPTDSKKPAVWPRTPPHRRPASSPPPAMTYCSPCTPPVCSSPP